MTPGEPYDIAIEGWLVDYADPFDIMNVLIRGASVNSFGHLDDPFSLGSTLRRCSPERCVGRHMRTSKWA